MSTEDETVREMLEAFNAVPLFDGTGRMNTVAERLRAAYQVARRAFEAEQARAKACKATAGRGGGCVDGKHSRLCDNLTEMHLDYNDSRDVELARLRDEVSGSVGEVIADTRRAVLEEAAKVVERQTCEKFCGHVTCAFDRVTSSRIRALAPEETPLRDFQK